MKFGLNINHLRSGDGQFVTEVARAAEDLGFESLWAGEHVVMPADYKSRYPYSADGRIGVGDHPVTPDPLVLLTWAAAATTQVQLGTAVLILPQRNPLVLAKEAATLDVLCAGRLLLGVGVGWLREEAEAVGIDFDTRGRRMDEYLLALQALWREQEATFEGKFVRFERACLDPRPFRTSGVRMIIGGDSKAAIRRAAELGDGYWPMAAPADLAGSVAALREATKRAGRVPEAIEVTTYAPPDLESARVAADAGVDRLVLFPVGYRDDAVTVRAKLARYVERVMEPLNSLS